VPGDWLLLCTAVCCANRTSRQPDNNLALSWAQWHVGWQTLRRDAGVRGVQARQRAAHPGARRATAGPCVRPSVPIGFPASAMTMHACALPLTDRSGSVSPGNGRQRDGQLRPPGHRQDAP
jgi:hypothetical protein